MDKGNLLYEGKAKKVYKTDRPGEVIVEFKNDATAFDGQKKGQITGKGAVNTEVSTVLFNMLAKAGVPTHQIKKLSETEMLVKELEIIPVEVVTRNIVAGSLVNRLGLEEGTKLADPILEFYYKNDELGDPLINEYHIFSQQLATKEELERIKELAFKINQHLVKYFKEREINLVDFKLEFGKDEAGKIYLADEISPDTCRLWDLKTDKKLDKDRFRRDLGDVEEAYQEISKRLTK